jgi:hypothetical protein
MSKCRRELRADVSGQLLIVAAFAIAILISSTTVYVYELSREESSSDTQLTSDFVFALKQSARNAVISSLANVSNGGNRTVLSANLDELSQVVNSINRLGICSLAFTQFNDSYYDSGIWLSWNTTDTDVSSAYVDFNLSVSDNNARASVGFAVNVTTTFIVNGSYTVEGAEKHVNLTCRVYNDGQPALAGSMVVFYESSGDWIQIDSLGLSTVDYGDGSYVLSFVVPSEIVDISVSMVDMRGVLVEARYSMA